MPTTNNSASWDFNPGDTVHLSASFSFDTQDTQDSTPVASALAAIQARLERLDCRRPNRSGDNYGHGFNLK